MKSPLKTGKGWIKLLIAGGMAGLMSILVLSSLPIGNVYAQQPTGNVPTVTGTPTGPHITAYSDQTFIDVYAGPSSYDYEKIGIMAAGTSAPALGYSQDNNWIEIVYLGVPNAVGWVYAPFVSITPGTSFNLRTFHERFMTNGIAPIWAHRQLMLPGDTAQVIQ